MMLSRIPHQTWMPGQSPTPRDEDSRLDDLCAISLLHRRPSERELRGFCFARTPAGNSSLVGAAEPVAAPADSGLRQRVVSGRQC
jgi:hypothetical protein